MSNLIRGRFHPNLHPVLRVVHSGPRCRSDGPWFVDEEGKDEVSFGCSRPAGHTGRHFAWEWDGDGQAIHVWTDAESSGYVSDGREGQP